MLKGRRASKAELPNNRYQASYTKMLEIYAEITPDQIRVIAASWSHDAGNYVLPDALKVYRTFQRYNKTRTCPHSHALDFEEEISLHGEVTFHDERHVQ